jgi:hypothetical protein
LQNIPFLACQHANKTSFVSFVQSGQDTIDRFVVFRYSAIWMLFTDVTFTLMNHFLRFVRHCACPLIIFLEQAYHNPKVFKLFFAKYLRAGSFFLGYSAAGNFWSFIFHLLAGKCSGRALLSDAGHTNGQERRREGRQQSQSGSKEGQENR